MGNFEVGGSKIKKIFLGTKKVKKVFFEEHLIFQDAWSFSVYLGTGMASFRYKIDNGSWITKTSDFTIDEIPGDSTLTVEGFRATAGYIPDTSSHVYTSENASGSITLTGTRITWTLKITKGVYMSSVYYKLNSGSAVTVTSSVTLDLDYADVVEVDGTTESEAPYNYTKHSAGTLSYSSPSIGNKETTVYADRSVKSYTLTISVTGSSYGSYEVKRTSSPYAGAPLKGLSNGATIYYGDVLTGSSSAASTRYGDWDCTESDLAAPSGSWNGGATTSPSITVTSSCSVGAELYRRKSGSSSWSDLGWVNSGASITDTGLSFNTSYIYYFGRNKTRSYWTRSASSSNYTGTNGVTGNVTASFTFTENAAQTETVWITTSQTRIYTGDVASYTLTISVSGSEYGSYSVKRTSSPVAGAATGFLSNGATIYYGDVLVGTSTANPDSEVSWDSWGTITAPTLYSTTGAAYSGNFILKNEDGYTCDIYYNTSNSAGGTYISTPGSGGVTSQVTGLLYNRTYYVSAARTMTRGGTFTRYTKSSSNYTGTDGVSGNVTASFSFGYHTETTSEQEYRYSSTRAVATAQQASYTIRITNSTDSTVTVSGGLSGTIASGSATTFTKYYGDQVTRVYLANSHQSGKIMRNPGDVTSNETYTLTNKTSQTTTEKQLTKSQLAVQKKAFYLLVCTSSEVGANSTQEANWTRWTCSRNDGIAMSTSVTTSNSTNYSAQGTPISGSRPTVTYHYYYNETVTVIDGILVNGA